MSTIHIALSKEEADAWERLRQLCGHATIAETMTKALKLYSGRGVCQECRGFTPNAGLEANDGSCGHCASLRPWAKGAT